MTQYDHAPTVRLADIASHTRGNTANLNVPRRIRVLLNVGGDRILRGHTLHVGVEHLTVSVPEPLKPDQDCAVFFGLTIEDCIYSIIGAGRVCACAPNTGGGYRAEMRFAVEDKKSRIALEQLFGDRPSVCIE